MRIIITGQPKAGKTEFLLRLADYFSKKGLSVGGMVTNAVLDDKGNRIGFEILNTMTGEIGVLATKGGAGVPHEGYSVNVQDLENIGIPAIEQAVKSCDVVLIDEIGPMELKSEAFRRKYHEAFESGKHVIATAYHTYAPSFQQGEWKRKVDYVLNVSAQSSDLCLELMQNMFKNVKKPASKEDLEKLLGGKKAV